jgi:2-polyprenyl-3-methyl-5-hydroxy-6-metoxy-1,4-benzoquinol methylase
VKFQKHSQIVLKEEEESNSAAIGRLPNEAGQFSEEYFTRTSTYARYPGTGSARTAIIRWYEGLFRYLDHRDGGQLDLPQPVLEVGCGHGAVLELLARRDFRPIGSDISGYILGQAQEMHPDLALLASDLTHMAIRDASLGTVFALEVLEHVIDVPVALGEVRRVLRPGGRLIATTPNPAADRLPFTNSGADPTHVSVHPPERWTHLLLEAGFQNVRITTVWQLPLLWRYSTLLSRTVPLPRLGPTCLIFARL